MITPFEGKDISNPSKFQEKHALFQLWVESKAAWLDCHFGETPILPASIPFKRYSGVVMTLSFPSKGTPCFRLCLQERQSVSRSSAFTSSASFTLLRAMSRENLG